METVSISLSKDQKEFVDAQMAARRHRSVSAYLNALIQAERKRRAEEELLTLVREAQADGPATPLAPNEWAEIRREVSQGIARRKRRQKLTG